MREIKFRGKLKGDDEWVYGFPAFVEHYPYDGTKGGAYIWKIPCVDNIVAVDPETVGQYTGLKDKNGVEIYEGDILQFEDYPPAKVLWCDASFCVGSLGEIADYPLSDWYDGTVVIGNIHDNPELMEVE